MLRSLTSLIFLRCGAVCRLACAIIALSFINAQAQEDASTPDSLTSAELADLSESTILNQARSVKDSDPYSSSTLAKEALRLAKTKQNHQIAARAHRLLSELAHQRQDAGDAKHHALQASLAYQYAQDYKNYSISSLDYADLFFEQKAYDEGHEVIDAALTYTQQRGDNNSVIRILSAKGDAHLKQKSYTDAITTYTSALEYFTGKDTETQRSLGLTYHQIAQAHKRLKDHKQSSAFHRRALDTFILAEDQELVARACKNIAIAEHKSKNYEEALAFVVRGIKLHSQLNDPEEFSNLLIMGSILYRETGKYENALEYIYEAHQIAKELNNTAKIAETSNQMGHLNTRLKRFDKARFFYQLTIDLPEKEVTRKALASAAREIAVIDSKAGKYDYAMRMAKKAYNIYREINETKKSSATARIIGEIHKAQNNKEKAIEYFRESLAIALETNDSKVQIKALNYLGRALVNTKPNEAIKLLRKSLKIPTKSEVTRDRLSTYKALRRAEKSVGNFREALDIADEEIALAKKINEINEKDNLAKVKAKIDSHQTDMELDSLRRKVKLDELELIRKNSEIEIARQANRISELELTENRYASILLIILLVICLCAAIYIYRIFIVSRNHNKELNYLANRDPLTNCYNRRILFDILEKDFANMEEFDEYCVILADLDYFKNVNDTHGHSAGDALLCGVADILQTSVRQSDITARYGGEEFCIVLPNTSQRQAKRIAENIRLKIESSRIEDLMVTCSFGVSSIRFNAKTPNELIDQADKALYKSKDLGRNIVTLWEPKLDNDSDSSS